MNTFALLLAKILRWIEIAGLLLTFFAITFKLLHLAGADSMLLIGLMTLASAYFFCAFTMVEIKVENQTQKRGFVDNLGLLLRKVMFIGLAVYCVAMLFTFLHFEGVKEMMIIGMGTITICTFISMTLVLVKREQMVILKAPLIRCLAGLMLYLVMLLFR